MLTEQPSALALPLDLRGTAFQSRVWAVVLSTICRGTTQFYALLAEGIGAPQVGASGGQGLQTRYRKIILVDPCGNPGTLPPRLAGTVS